MKKIYIYSGTGAYQVKDIENFCSVFDLKYYRLCEHQLSILKPSDIFIVPGGLISAYLSAWGKEGVNKIKNFVKNGGVYIGICSGAYVAGINFNNQKGLNFFKETLVYQKHRNIVFVKDKDNKKLNLIAENGPDISIIKADDFILKDNKDIPYAIKVKYSKGRAYLFSAHPEGSVYYNKPPQKFSGAKWFSTFLKNL